MRLEKIFDKIIKGIFIFLFSWIIICLFLFSKIKYFCKKDFLIPNFLIFCILFFIFLLYKFFREPIYDFINKKILTKLKKIKIKKINTDKVVKKLVIVFFFIQLYIFYHIFFETGWDSGWFIIPNAKAIITRGELNLNYYSWFPNNMLITSIYALILRLNDWFGVFNQGYELMSIVVVNCLISSISSILIYKIAKKYLNNKYAFIGYIVSIIMIVLSPWNIICYSDSFSIFIPILILYIYSNSKLNKYIKWPLLFVLAYIGYSIKPQNIMIFFSIITINIIRKLSIKKIKEILTILIISIIPVIIVNYSLNRLYKFERFKLDSEMKIGITHFLMMGSNPKTDGVYYDKDISYSSSIKSKKERSKKNIQVYLKRVKKYGFTGYIQFLSKKNLINYNDGTFAWGVEGGFYDILKPEISKITKHLRKIYYNDEALFKYYSTFVHINWISILTVIFIGSFYALKNKKNNYIYSIIILSISYLTIFELLFEARARYLYCNLPLYILLMLYSLNLIIKGEKDNGKENIIRRRSLLQRRRRS